MVASLARLRNLEVSQKAFIEESNIQELKSPNKACFIL